MSAIAHSIRKHWPVALLPALLCVASHGQTAFTQVPAATPISIQLLQHVPMKTGEPLGTCFIRCTSRIGSRYRRVLFFAARSYNSIRTETAGYTHGSGETSLHSTSLWCALMNWCFLAEPSSRSKAILRKMGYRFCVSRLLLARKEALLSPGRSPRKSNA
jgi:hypothetical protein